MKYFNYTKLKVTIKKEEKNDTIKNFLPTRILYFYNVRHQGHDIQFL